MIQKVATENEDSKWRCIHQNRFSLFTESPFTREREYGGAGSSLSLVCSR